MVLRDHYSLNGVFTLAVKQLTRKKGLHSASTRAAYNFLRDCLGEQFGVCSDLTAQILALPAGEDGPEVRELRRKLQIEDARYNALNVTVHSLFKVMYGETLDDFDF